MAVNIGPKIGIDGEAEYRKELQNLIQATKTYKSEMEALTSAFDKNGSKLNQNKQKYEQLKKQQKATKDEIEKLRNAVNESEKKTGETSTTTLKWKDALAKAETELNKINDELTNSHPIKGFADDLKAASEKLDEIGNKMKDVGSSLTTHVTAPIVAAGTFAVKTAAEFETAMDSVQAVSGATGEEMEDLESKARSLGSTTKFSASEVASAYSYMGMAGWKSGQMIEGVDGILNLAAASNTDLATASDIVTDALTAFGESASEAGRLADIMATASSNANTNVELMGETFQYVAPVAGAMGYSMEDVAVATGLMANAGIKGSKSGTAMRTMLTNLAKPTQSMQEAMDYLGISLEDGEGGMKSLNEIMVDLRNSFGEINMSAEDYDAALARLNSDLEAGAIKEDDYNAGLDDLNKKAFGAAGALNAQYAATIAGKEGMSGLLAIVSASDEDFNKLTDAVNGSEGAAADMAATMQDNLNGKITELKSKLEEIAIQFGEKLQPTIEKIVIKLGEFADKMSELDSDQVEMILKIGLIVAAAGPLISIIGTIISVVSGITGAISAVVGAVGVFSGALSAGTPLVAAFGAAFGTATLPIIAIVAAIAAVIAIGVLLYKNWDEIKAGAAELWSKMVEVFTNIKDSVSKSWTELKTKASETWSNIKSTVTDKVQSLKTAASEKFNAIKTDAIAKFTDLKTKASSKFNEIKTAITEKIQGAKDKVKDAVDKIKGFFNFTWSLPSLKMPHFSASGSFSLNPLSVPKISVSWYKKAYSQAYALDGAQIFGAMGGKLLGGGERGRELVMGEGYLQNVIVGAMQKAVGYVPGAGSTSTSFGDTNITVYGAPGQDVNELADIIERKIAQHVRKRGAAW